MVHDSASASEDTAADVGEVFSNPGGGDHFSRIGSACCEAAAEGGDWAVLTPTDAEKARNAVTTKALAAAPLPRSNAFLPDEPDHTMPVRQENSNASRIQGRVGLDYSGITSSGSTPGYSRQMGISFQSDMTHLFGTHWNLQGYWRGRINQHSQFQEQTVQNVLNKTYTMQLYYDNPDSAWVAGFGRLYLPWAVSLDTIDGGYVGREVGNGVTTGVFGGDDS